MGHTLNLPIKESSALNLQLWGGPGVGKSSVAAGVFYQLKLHGVCCEAPREFVKDEHYRGELQLLSQQTIIEQQYRNHTAAIDQVDVLVAECPAATPLAYCTPEEYAAYAPQVRRATHDWVTLDVLLLRNPEYGYQTTGRTQTAEEALRFEQDIFIPFVKNWVGAKLIEVPSSSSTVAMLTELVLKRLASNL